MSGDKTEVIVPACEEDAIIDAQIAADPDCFEADDEWFRNAKTTAELFPEILKGYRQRQADLAAGVIEEVSITLDAEIVKWFRVQAGEDGETGGTGWKSLVNNALREYIAGGRREENL